MVHPNKRQATQSGDFSATTLWAGAIISPGCVVTRSSSGTTPRSVRLARQEYGLRQRDVASRVRL